MAALVGTASTALGAVGVQVAGPVSAAALAVSVSPFCTRFTNKKFPFSINIHCPVIFGVAVGGVVGVGVGVGELPLPQPAAQHRASRYASIARCFMTLLLVEQVGRLQACGDPSLADS